MPQRQSQNTSYEGGITNWSRDRVRLGRLEALCPSNPARASAPHPPDPLATAVEHNARSLLSGLPKELLNSIMYYLDPASMFCLRRVSRIFLRLFSSAAFSPMHDKEGFFERGPWTAQKVPNGGDWFTAASLINQDMYCGLCHLGCLRTAFRHMSHYMHCSGCNRDHPMSLFSAKQRGVDRSARVCIGFEGSVRLCQHRSIRVGDIVEDEHGIRKFTCHHPSHLPMHHRKFLLRRAPLRPTLEMDQSYGRSAVISHTAHLDLSGHGNEPITAEAFRAHIRELRKGPAGDIVPEYAPGILPELRCFDPSRCGCLVYPGLKPHEGACEEHKVTRTLFSRISVGTNTISIKFESCRHGARCLKVTHARTLHFRTGLSASRLRGRDIPERARGAVCDARWKLARGLDAVAGPASYNWFSAIDPASYALAKDQQLYALTWCYTRGCANYHGYLRERMVRSQRLNAMCKGGCEAGMDKGKEVVGDNGVFELAKGTGWNERCDEVAGQEVSESCTIM